MRMDNTSTDTKSMVASLGAAYPLAVCDSYYTMDKNIIYDMLASMLLSEANSRHDHIYVIHVDPLGQLFLL